MAQKLTKEEYICPDCGHIGRGAIPLRGSAVLERILWYVLLIPGPLYSFWRRSGNEIECPDCQNPLLVPLESKLGIVMLENQLKKKKD